MEAASNRRAKINDRRRDCEAIPDTEPGLQTHSWFFYLKNPEPLLHLSQRVVAVTAFSSTGSLNNGSVPVPMNVPQWEMPSTGSGTNCAGNVRLAKCCTFSEVPT